MNREECKNIIVIGEAKIYKMVCRLVWNSHDIFLFSFIKYNNNLKEASYEVLNNNAENMNVDLGSLLSEIVVPTLVINAGSYYIYPQSVLGNKCLQIINYHNAMLPYYKGRNASSWVIYNDEKNTGVTWHKVTEDIDGGEIIIQEKLEIGIDEKAYELAHRQMKLAYSLFEKLWDMWLNGQDLFSGCFAQSLEGDMYYSHEVPNGGMIDLRTDTGELISRVLRSMDYGKFSPFPPITLIDKNGDKHTVVRYRFTQSIEEDCGNVFFVEINNKRYIEIFVRGGVFLGRRNNYERLYELEKGKVDFLDIHFAYEELVDKIALNEYEKVLVMEEDNYLANRLLWECKCLKETVIINGDNPYAVETKTPKMMNSRLWEYITVNAETQIEAGGWRSSYDFKPFSEIEMEEYADNIYLKLHNYLNKENTVLEVGCASCITAFRLAPLVKKYIATDMAKEQLRRSAQIAKEREINNVDFIHCRADEITCLLPEKVDLVILNSVVQYFPGINYLKEVVEQACELLGYEGIIYLGDIMDLDKKDELRHTLIKYKEENPKAKTKKDLSEELFLCKEYFSYLKNIVPYIKDIEITDKIATIKNEMSEYRYDVVLYVGKCQDKSRNLPGVNKLQRAEKILM